MDQNHTHKQTPYLDHVGLEKKDTNDITVATKKEVSKNINKEINSKFMSYCDNAENLNSVFFLFCWLLKLLLLLLLWRLMIKKLSRLKEVPGHCK